MMESELDNTIRALLVEEALKDVGRTDFTGVCGDLVRLILERVGRPYPDDQRLRDIGEAVKLLNDAQPGDILFGHPSEKDYLTNEPRMSGIIIEAARVRYTQIGKFVSVFGGAKRGNIKSIQIREYMFLKEGYQDSQHTNYRVRRIQ